MRVTADTTSSREQLRPLRVALYARVSTRDKDQDPEVQIASMRDYVEAKGWNALTYVDLASAADMARRSAWARLITDARQRRIDLVLVWKLDRACVDCHRKGFSEGLPRPLAPCGEIRDMNSIRSRRILLIAVTMAAVVSLVGGGVALASGTQPARLVVSPTMAGPGGDSNTPDCGSRYSTCKEILSEPGNASSPVAWSVSGDSVDSPGYAPESFSPSHGTIKPGQSVTVTVTNMDCDAEGLWLFNGIPTISAQNHGEVGAAVIYTCG